MLKDDQDYCHIGGGLSRPLRDWSDFSTIKYPKVLMDNTIKKRRKNCVKLELSGTLYQFLRIFYVGTQQENSKVST